MSEEKPAFDPAPEFSAIRDEASSALAQLEAERRRKELDEIRLRMMRGRRVAVKFVRRLLTLLES